ncbi:MAG: hypothetical protein ACRCV9_03070 [Burkholderiaceae bacterium]
MNEFTITHAPIKAGTALTAGAVAEASSATPVGGTLSTQLTHWTLGDWASALAIAYTLILIGEWAWKKYKAFRKDRESTDAQDSVMQDE